MATNRLMAPIKVYLLGKLSNNINLVKYLIKLSFNKFYISNILDVIFLLVFLRNIK